MQVCVGVEEFRGDSSTRGDTAHQEVIEGSDRVGLRPQANLARARASVTMIQQQLAVEGGLNVLAHRYDP
jgi:hypothetical protein